MGTSEAAGEEQAARTNKKRRRVDLMNTPFYAVQPRL